MANAVHPITDLVDSVVPNMLRLDYPHGFPKGQWIVAHMPIRAWQTVNLHDLRYPSGLWYPFRTIGTQGIILSPLVLFHRLYEISLYLGCLARRFKAHFKLLYHMTRPRASTGVQYPMSGKV